MVGQRPSEDVLAKQVGGDDSGTNGSAMREETPVAPGTALGLSLQALTPQIAAAINVPPATRGVVVTAVDASGDASDKGIRRGDVIISVNRQPVATPQAVMAAVETARRAGRTSVLLLVKRAQAPEAFVGVEIAKR